MPLSDIEALETLIPDTIRSPSRSVRCSRALSLPPRTVATRSSAKLSGFDRLGAGQPRARAPPPPAPEGVAHRARGKVAGMQKPRPLPAQRELRLLLGPIHGLADD